MKRRQEKEEDQGAEQEHERERMERKRRREGNGRSEENRRTANERDKDEYMRDQITKTTSAYALLGCHGDIGEGGNDEGLSAFMRTTKDQGGQL